jgi:calcineurin-like phosphoesterase family protein
MKKVFVTSDNHFGHLNLIKYCDRPLDIDAQMIHNWNRNITENDVVFVVGDFVIANHSNKNYLKMIVERLNGNKILIRGNHDHMSDDEFKNDFGFRDVKPFFVCGETFLCHYPLYETDEELEKQMKQIKKAEDVGKLIDMYEAYNDSECKYVIHGHIHSIGPEVADNHYNVAIDRNNYCPLLYTDVLVKLAHAVK